MDAPAFENLDLACAKTGQAIAEKPSKELENLVTSALAVLEEQGVYALFLFLETRGGDVAKTIGKTIGQRVRELLRKTPRQAPLLPGDGNVFALLQSMSEDLDKLLLARDLLRQTLVYARYHVRAPQKSESRT